jgi:hypothetical protein
MRFEFFKYLKDDGAGVGAFDHPRGSGTEIGIVKVGVLAAILWPILVDGACIIFKERTWRLPDLPDRFAVILFQFKIVLSELFNG